MKLSTQLTALILALAVLVPITILLVTHNTVPQVLYFVESGSAMTAIGTALPTSLPSMPGAKAPPEA